MQVKMPWAFIASDRYTNPLPLNPLPSGSMPAPAPSIDAAGEH